MKVLGYTVYLVSNKMLCGAVIMLQDPNKAVKYHVLQTRVYPLACQFVSELLFFSIPTHYNFI